MKAINIFLGSSIVELKEERDAFSDIVNELNFKLKNTGNFIYLYKCEYEDGFFNDEPTQKIIDNKILESTYSYFIIKTKFGKMTEHEFNVAQESFFKYGKPKLSVMFGKCSENEQCSPETLSFKSKLEDLKYYYKEYQNKEELKLNIVLNLVVDDILSVSKLKAEDGGIYFEGVKLVDFEQIPIYSKHSELFKLNKQLFELENEERKSDDRHERRIIREKINLITSKIREIENLIFNTMLGLVKVSRGKVTPLLSRAIVYLENGDIEKAAEILNIDDVIDELDVYKEKTELSICGIQSAIETAYIAVESMIQLPKTSSRNKEIELLYEKIISIEINYNLNRVHSGLYARYLLKNKKYAKALRFLNLYLEATNIRMNCIQDFASLEYTLLGLQIDMEPLYNNDKKEYQKIYLDISYKHILAYEQALKKFEHNWNINQYMMGYYCDRILDILKKWIGSKDDNVKDIEKDIRIKIDLLKKVGYKKTSNSTVDGKEECKKLVDYIEIENELNKLNNEPQTDNPQEYLKQYVELLEKTINYMKNSENVFLENNTMTSNFYKEYENIKTALYEDNKEDILFYFAQVKIGHAEHYLKVANFTNAKNDYRAAYDILKELLKLNNPVYDFFFCGVCSGFSKTLINLSDSEKGEKIILEGISICEDLVIKKPCHYVFLAKMYADYVSVCMNGRVYDCINKALEYSLKSYNIFKNHVNIADDVYKLDFIYVCYNYAHVLVENGKKDEAFKYLMESLDAVNLLSEKSIQDNYSYIKDIVLFALSISSKIGKIDQILTKLENLYTKETIEKLISLL